MRAATLVIGQHAGAIDSHQIMQPEEAVTGKNLLANEDFDTSANDFLKLRDFQVAVGIVERITMREIFYI
jgi:hypothetical protein